VVADDIDLGITHVIRGDDHVNNTPRQILIYNALGETLPLYAHLPMILGPDKARLSKRHGAMSVLEYREMGYLPHALLNALVRVGWSYGDQEKFTLEEMIEKFSLDHVGKSAGVFNTEKLQDLNAWYIRESSDEFLVEQVMPFLRKAGVQEPDMTLLKEIIPHLKARSKTLVEMAEGAKFCFAEEIVYEQKGDDKFLRKEIVQLLDSLANALAETDPFDQETLEKAFIKFLEENDIKLRKIAQPLRIALTGKTASPGIFEVMQVLGKETVTHRIRKAVNHINAK